MCFWKKSTSSNSHEKHNSIQGLMKGHTIFLFPHKHFGEFHFNQNPSSLVSIALYRTSHVKAFIFGLIVL